MFDGQDCRVSLKPHCFPSGLLPLTIKLVMTFQAPTSLAGTLAEYERRKSLQLAHGPKSAASSVHEELAVQPLPDAIYKRTLPSLHFLRWRPLYHVQAPSGWMNDPCAPGYDPSTELYHLFFQWNPKRNEHGAVAWGSICWGHASSKDMLNWTVEGTATISPGAWYDKQGCFTGGMVATNVSGQSGITLFYTGVSRLPLHYTLPYKNGTETLAVAQMNSSREFTKMRGNPVLAEPPPGVNVSGFRDPFIGRWPSIDLLLDQQPGSGLYGVISGGLKDTASEKCLTPTIFLFAINPEKLTQWVYLGAMNNLGINHNISRWSGDMGHNWECANVMTLVSEVDGSRRDFVVVGAEGADRSHPNSIFTEYPQQATKFPREERSLQWMCGRIVAGPEKDGRPTPTMEYVSGGRFDHSLMYGVNSFFDPVSGKQTAYGWITEEDLPQHLVDRQNWSGLMSIPRDLSLIVIKNVVGALTSRLQDITTLELETDKNNTFKVRTLGISPSQRLERLRNGSRHVRVSKPQALSLNSRIGLDVQTCRFELAASFEVSDNCRRVGLSMYHTQELSSEHATSIYLMTESETLMIDRPDTSHVDPDILTFSERAPFTLLTLAQADGSNVREQLQIRAFFDESVLEVFVNDRCTFATRIYPATKRMYGIRFWADDDTSKSKLLSAKAWDGLRADIRVS